MTAKLTDLIDPTLSPVELRELHADACWRNWEEGNAGTATDESYKNLCEEADAALFIAWLKERGFNVTR